METAMSRLRRFGMLGTLFVALLHVGLWANAHWRPLPTVSLALPIAPGREMHVNVWKPVKDNTSWGFGGALAHEIDRPLTIMVWYNHTGASSITRLLAMRAPTWPLLGGAVVFGLIAALLWRPAMRRAAPTRILAKE
jgi:hypothetical protein